MRVPMLIAVVLVRTVRGHTELWGSPMQSIELSNAMLRRSNATYARFLR